eukprot:Pgem_evm1s14635
MFVEAIQEQQQNKVIVTDIFHNFQQMHKTVLIKIANNNNNNNNDIYLNTKLTTMELQYFCDVFEKV